MAQQTELLKIPPELGRIGEAISSAGGNPVLVGGWIRDHLLGNPHAKDFDIEVFGIRPGDLKRVLRAFGAVHEVGKHFGVLKLSTADAEYDVSVPRREQKTGKGHKGFQVDADPTMTFQEAAARRDFTINSMGYAFQQGELLDPYEGRRDLNDKVLRHVGPAFGEDPLRVMRAMQFVGRFGLTIPPETLAICRSQDLSELPRERLWEEFRKLLLKSPKPSQGLQWMEPLGILPYFPELDKLTGGDQWPATLEAVDRAAEDRAGPEADDLPVICAALAHRMGVTPGGEPSARALGHWLEQLTNETRFLDLAQALVRELPLAAVPADPASVDTTLRRLALRVPLPLLERVFRACVPAGERTGATGAMMADRARELGVWDAPPEPLLKGRHLQELGAPPGREMGAVLKAAFERQLDGELATLEEAIAWARQTLESSAGG